MCQYIGYDIRMAGVEREAKTKRRKRDLRSAVLATVGVVGVIAVAAIAPNIVQLLETTGINARLRFKTKRVLTRLKIKGEIEFIKQNGSTFVRLTKQGRQALAMHSEKMRIIAKKPKKWDERYRLVMFDVPERRKWARDLLRREMREVGFLRVQDSAWLYPYDCEEFISLLKADLHIGKDVLYAVVDSIDNDVWVRKHFNLPSRDA